MKLNIHPSKLPSLVSVSQTEGETLAKLAKRMLPGSVFVEVGVLTGASLCWIASGAPKDCIFYAVDGWDLLTDKTPYPYTVIEETFKSNIKNTGLSPWVTPIKKLSLAAAKDWNKPIDFLHIDAAHDYDSCKADILAWEPHLKPGGTIALHDADQLGVSFAIYDTIHKSGNYTMYRQSQRLFSAVKF